MDEYKIIHVACGNEMTMTIVEEDKVEQVELYCEECGHSIYI